MKPRWKQVKGENLFFLGFLCNCLSCFTTAKITFTCILYLQFIPYAHQLINEESHLELRREQASASKNKNKRKRKYFIIACVAMQRKMEEGEGEGEGRRRGGGGEGGGGGGTGAPATKTHSERSHAEMRTFLCQAFSSLPFAPPRRLTLLDLHSPGNKCPHLGLLHTPS